MTDKIYDSIVVGVGSMGASALWQLAERGQNVLGLEQYTLPHDHGSHGGQSRIIRQAYYEHPDYVPLLKRSYHQLERLEHASSEQLFYRTGIMYYGHPTSPVIRGMLESARQYDLDVKYFDRDIQHDGVIAKPDDFVSAFEAHAGFMLPDKTILAMTDQARRAGAEVHEQEQVVDIRRVSGDMEVVTQAGRYRCRHLLLTQGAWASQFLHEKLAGLLRVTQQVLAWAAFKPGARCLLGELPCWFIDDPNIGPFYGFPSLPSSLGGPSGMKLALHVPGEVVAAEGPRPGVSREDIERITYCLRTYFPTIGGEITHTRTCLYTYSPDEHFIIDQPDGFDGQVTIACGFSGHGFKFSPVVGEILADLAITGTTPLPIDFLRLKRF